MEDSEYASLRCYVDDALESKRPYPPNASITAHAAAETEFNAADAALELARQNLQAADAAAKGNFTPRLVDLSKKDDTNYKEMIAWLAFLELNVKVRKEYLSYLNKKLAKAKASYAALP